MIIYTPTVSFPSTINNNYPIVCNIYVRGNKTSINPLNVNTLPFTDFSTWNLYAKNIVINYISI